MLTMPLLYYPSTIAWIDDDALFLKSSATLFNSQHRIVDFTNPHEFLRFFSEYSSPLTEMISLRPIIENELYGNAQHMPVDFDVSQLWQIHYRCASRHKEISVIIIDYNMPGLNGIELCKLLRHSPAKKILLTGEADHKEAVAAFNDNTIDRFIRKDDPNLVSELKMYITTLSQQYFRERTSALLSHIEADSLRPLSDARFVEFFQQWLRDNNIQEYFLFDKYGSFLLVDSDGQYSYFILHTDASLNAFVDLHDDIDEAKEYVEMVSKREKVPFFGVGVEGWKVDMREWEGKFFDFNNYNGRQKYYWTHKPYNLNKDIT